MNKANTINWCGYEWITQERWGQVHPEKPNWWYDETGVIIDESNNLHLLTHHNPKHFIDQNIFSFVGVGLVSCTEKFSYGEFEIEAKLPYGNNLWPAFWMWSWDSWPPEIDVFEGYSDNNPNYLKLRLKNPLGFWNLQTNVHYNDEKGNKMTGGKTHYFGFKDPTKNFIKYKVEWRSDSIKFYYDNRLVREITDKKILNQFKNTTMNVIINNGITKDANPTDINKSDFIIKYFKYNSYE